VIEKNKFEQLLNEPEGWVLDFKRDQYRFENQNDIAKFIKDILSMANTIREDTSYIILGVRHHTDGKKEFFGIKNHIDDSHFQEKMKNNVHPIPKFLYYTFEYNGFTFGIFEIPVVKQKGPYKPIKKIGGILEPHVIYHRQGSSNQPATHDDSVRIHNWLYRNIIDNKIESQTEEIPIPHWDDFQRACHVFDKARLFALVIGPDLKVPKEQLSLFGKIDWALVFDFNPDTENNGLYNAVKAEMYERRYLHLFTLNDKQKFIPDKATYWFAVNGLIGRNESLIVPSNWRNWYRKYSIYIREILIEFAKSSSDRLIDIVILWDSVEYIRSICENFEVSFGEMAHYIFAVENLEKISSLQTLFEGDKIPINISKITNGLRRIRGHSHQTKPKNEQIWIPSLKSGSVVISNEQYCWIQEDLELLHLDIGTKEEENRQIGLDFYRGNPITWLELGLHYDVDRDITKGLLKLVEKKLNIRKADIVYFYHWPGTGGSTVGRRVAWDFHEKFPTFILNSLRVEETISRLLLIFEKTQLSILLIVEASDVNLDEMEKFFSGVKSRNIPVVFLVVQRSFGLRNQKTKETIYLDANLNEIECYRFAQVYSREMPSKKSELNNIVYSSESKIKTPFYFCLTAFGKDFVNLTDYVNRRVKEATEKQKKILGYISMSYHYSQQPLSSQLFSTLINFPENRVIRPTLLFSEAILELILVENDIFLRPIHEIIAEELMKQLFSGNHSDRRIWKQNISTWSLNFINICALHFGVREPSYEIMDILRRLFYLRDNLEPLVREFNKFSQLIEDIPNREGKLAIFLELIKHFPYEAHFWAHLARFYSVVLEQTSDALIAVEKAIELSPKDSILYHIKGMCLRRKIYSFLDQLRYKKNLLPDKLEKTKKIAEETGIQFEKARELNPQDDYGYISHIQLLIRLIEFGYNISKKKSWAEFLIDYSASWYRELLDLAEYLLEKVTSLRIEKGKDRYIYECKAKMSEFYGNYSKVIEGWNNLLSRNDIYRPPIRRQVVRAYVARKSNLWDRLNTIELKRILQLLEDNILEEPYSEKNIRLWFQAARHSSYKGIDEMIEKLSYWKINNESLEALFYLYILYVIKTLDGSISASYNAKDLILESSKKARNLRNRNWCWELYGKGNGARKLVHYKELFKEEDDIELDKDDLPLDLVDGRITEIMGPESGTIELESGLKVFFIPARGKIKGVEGGYLKGRDENKKVKFYLGFSYDGLRAWNVRLA